MKKYLPLILLITLLCGCRTDKTINDKDDFDESLYPVVGSDEIYQKIFDRHSRVEMTLDFTNEALKKLQDYGNTNTIQKEMYHPCNLTLKIDNDTYTFEEVGARMKGNTSRTNSFVKDDNSLDKNRFLNLKLSFKETFADEEDNDYFTHNWANKDDKKARKNRTLGGMKKLDLKWNKNFDYTFTRAAYAFYAYEQEGIPAQKDNIIQMTIKNQKDQVTFLMDMMESVDAVFLTNHFSEGSETGNLYKSLWTSCGPADFSRTSKNYIGIETPSYSPIYDLKTNDDEPDNSLLENLITTLNEDKRSAAEFKSTLDTMVDVDEFLKYSALSWVIGNPDDMRNDYNNFFSYFRSDNNKLVIIPYDLDRCFGIMQDWEIHTESYKYDSNKRVTAENETLRNPLFYRTFLTGTEYYGTNFEVNQEYKNRYEEYCNQYSIKYLNVDKFRSFTKDFPFVEKNISTPGYSSNLTFAQYATEKLKFTNNL